MGLFEHFPYTNFHELNLGWLVEEVKKLSDEMGQYDVHMEELVDQWLTDHPEYVTTVVDGSLTLPKFAESLKQLTVNGYVTPEMFGAEGDGVADDTQAVQDALDDGKPVYFAGTYKVTAALTAGDSYLFGRGKIAYAGSYIRNLLSITGKCLMKDITIDGNDACAIAVMVVQTDNAIIKNVSISNCKNIATDPCSCSGLAIAECDNADISDCTITNISRVTTLPGVHSSTGIAVYAHNNVVIHGCHIENIHSTVESEECDGIYCAYLSTPVENMAYIYGNTIIDCTGRFVKTQAKEAIIDGNKCINSVAFTATRYFQPFSQQLGNFRITNNFVNLGSSYERVYTHIISAAMSNLCSDLTGVIKGNTFNYTTNATNQRCRSLLYIGVIDGIAGKIAIEVKDNNLLVPVESFLYLTASGSSTLSGNLTVEDNLLDVYQVAEGHSITLEGILVKVAENTFASSLGSSRFSSESLLIDNVIFRDNRGINETLNNYPLDYTKIKVCDIYYRGAIQPMQNVPAAMGDGTYLYLQKTSTVAKYCDLAHQTTLGVTQA